VSLKSEIAADAAEIMRDLGEDNDDEATHTWAGASYPCGATTELAGVMVTIDGNTREATLGLLVQASNYPNNILPQSGAKIGWNGKTYKVGRVRNLHGAAAWLYCVDFNSGK